MRRDKNSSDREKLKLELSNIFNQLNIDDIGEGVKVSVPNGTKSCTVSLNDGIYTVKNQYYLSTYKKLEEAVIEILEELVCRELYDNNFSVKEINFVVSKLIK